MWSKKMFYKKHCCVDIKKCTFPILTLLVEKIVIEWLVKSEARIFGVSYGVEIHHNAIVLKCVGPMVKSRPLCNSCIIMCTAMPTLELCRFCMYILMKRDMGAKLFLLCQICGFMCNYKSIKKQRSQRLKTILNICTIRIK